MDKNKKILIVSIVMTIIIVMVVAVITFLVKNNDEENKVASKVITLDLSQVFEIENIEKSKYEIDKADDVQIASKYIVGTNVYELNAQVEFMETLGKMIYVREDYNKLNIYQTEYKIEKYENVNSQVEGIIEEFEQICKGYLGVDQEEKAKSEELLNGQDSKNEIPLGESIYYKEKLYSKTYEIDEKTYDINFYRENEKIICEFVRQKGQS